MTATHQRQVVITGGCGSIGTLVARKLSDRYHLTLLDLQLPASDMHLPFIQANLTEYDAIERAFQGADTILHLAADPRPTASWERSVLIKGVGT